MSDLRGFLQDFTNLPVEEPEPTPEHAMDEAGLETIRLEAFESGYRAGWDDAVKAQDQESARLTAGLGQHLQDLSFTYHEAYGQVMAAMDPLLQDLVNKAMPEIVRTTLGLHVAELLTTEAKSAGAVPVLIAVPSDLVKQVQTLVDGDFTFPVEVTADETLTDMQAELRFGKSEKQIDLGGLLTSVAEAVEGFSHENLRKLSHG